MRRNNTARKLGSKAWIALLLLILCKTTPSLAGSPPADVKDTSRPDMKSGIPPFLSLENFAAAKVALFQAATKGCSTHPKDAELRSDVMDEIVKNHGMPRPQLHALLANTALDLAQTAFGEKCVQTLGIKLDQLEDYLDEMLQIFKADPVLARPAFAGARTAILSSLQRISTDAPYGDHLLGKNAVWMGTPIPIDAKKPDDRVQKTLAWLNNKDITKTIQEPRVRMQSASIDDVAALVRQAGIGTGEPTTQGFLGPQANTLAHLRQRGEGLYVTAFYPGTALRKGQVATTLVRRNPGMNAMEIITIAPREGITYGGLPQAGAYRFFPVKH